MWGARSRPLAVQSGAQACMRPVMRARLDGMQQDVVLSKFAPAVMFLTGRAKKKNETRQSKKLC